VPTVEFEDATGERTTVECAAGATLRDALLAADLPVHNGPRLVSCHGHGSCGTCAVGVEGPVDPPTPAGRERVRLSVPPHDPESGLRLACQVTVGGDLLVRKGGGVWGQHDPDGETGAAGDGETGAGDDGETGTGNGGDGETGAGDDGDGRRG